MMLRERQPQTTGEMVRSVRVESEQAGWRLDRAVILLCPGVGLRGRRRRIEAGLVRVDGRLHGAGYKVRAGEALEEWQASDTSRCFSPLDIPVLAQGEDFGAVAKPGGLHSVSLGPGGGESLEALLGTLFPDRAARLVSRLDCLTSGIVPVAFSAEAAASWRRLEDAGGVAKTYLAVVHGHVAEPMCLTRALDVDDRATTRVLAQETTDPLRQTWVTPVHSLAGLTLVRCRIAKGARHQIRAHLAAAGYPLVGDPRYGQGEGERLFLHCSAVTCAVLTVVCEPPWQLADAAAIVNTA